jgi:ABC-type multidrug transport system ATPase subunit
MDLVEEFTLSEQLEFHFRLRNPANRCSLAEIIDRMKMGDSREKAITNFSSGMKQRLKLGLAFFTEASAIFLDEPGTNLDEHALAWYHENLGAVAPDKTVIVASNQADEYPKTAIRLMITDYK